MDIFALTLYPNWRVLSEAKVSISCGEKWNQEIKSTSATGVDGYLCVDFISKLKGAIEEAQRRILEQSANKQISSDVIEVELYGPKFPDITLIDLPGIVRTVGKGEDERIIEEIMTMNMKYLKNER